MTTIIITLHINVGLNARFNDKDSTQINAVKAKYIFLNKGSLSFFTFGAGKANSSSEGVLSTRGA